MWKYIKRYLPLAVIAGLFMVGEVLMDLVQPGIMSSIVDQGALGLETGGAGTLITRVTNDITQVQNFISQFVRGMIRCLFLTLGSIAFLFMLNREFGLIMLCAFPFIVGVLAFCLWKANPLFSRLQAQLDKIKEALIKSGAHSRARVNLRLTLQIISSGYTD